MIDWLTERLIDLFIDWFIGWLIDLLTQSDPREESGAEVDRRTGPRGVGKN